MRQNIKQYGVFLKNSTQNRNSLDLQQRWAAFKKGDSAAFAYLYSYFSRSLIQYGYRVSTDTDLIKDSVQDLFVELWKSRESLADVNAEGIQFYLFRALRNKINANRRRTFLTDADNIPEAIDEALSSEESIIYGESQSEQHLLIERAIQKLSKRQREVINLRFVNDFSHDEIAQIMQLNYQSVSNLLFTSLQSLRKIFKVSSF